jgi:hypothetical protein
MCAGAGIAARPLPLCEPSPDGTYRHADTAKADLLVQSVFRQLPAFRSAFLRIVKFIPVDADAPKRAVGRLGGAGIHASVARAAFTFQNRSAGDEAVAIEENRGKPETRAESFRYQQIRLADPSDPGAGSGHFVRKRGSERLNAVFIQFIILEGGLDDQIPDALGIKNPGNGALQFK